MKENNRRRVAITGIGMITPLGNNKNATWDALFAGASGVDTIRSFDATGFPTPIAAEVKGFDLADVVEDRKLRRQAGPFSAFALAAAEEAFRDAELRPTAATAERWGLVNGSGMMTTEFEFFHRFQSRYATNGTIDFERFGRGGKRFISPAEFARHRAVAGLGLLHKVYDIRGYSNNVHTACASGGQALGLAMRAIRRGDADYVLCGGYDSMINPVGMAGFCLLGALSTNNDRPDKASRPFDQTREGFVLGEGAGFFVLEEWTKARERRANIYAELAGEGNSLSSYRITDSHPSGDGPIQSIRWALRDAGETIETVDYINAHGTSTKMNDLCETNALKESFGEHAERLAISSTKSQMGHLIAAAGAVEAGICALAIRDGQVPGTANLDNPDPECDLDYMADGPRKLNVDVAMSNSFGFGGSNSTLVLRSPARTEEQLTHA